MLTSRANPSLWTAIRDKRHQSVTRASAGAAVMFTSRNIAVCRFGDSSAQPQVFVVLPESIWRAEPRRSETNAVRAVPAAMAPEDLWTSVTLPTLILQRAGLRIDYNLSHSTHDGHDIRVLQHERSVLVEVTKHYGNHKYPRPLSISSSSSEWRA